MENETNSIGSLLEKTGDYLETRVELMKLQAVDKVTGTASSLASGGILIMVTSLMLCMLSIGVAVWLGKLTGELYCGFFIVGGFYMLLAIVLYAFRSTWLKKPFHDSLVKKILN